MKIAKIFAVLPFAAALAACGSVQPQQVEAEQDLVCENGAQLRVSGTTQGADRVKVTALNVPGNPSAVLQKAPAGQGARFANNAGFFGNATEMTIIDGVTTLSYSQNNNQIQTKCAAVTASNAQAAEASAAETAQ